MTQRIRTEWHLLLLAIQFLTRLPVPKDTPFSDDLLIRATRYYPLVGALVGLIGAVVLGVGALVLPVSVAVLLSMATTLLVTGAFHEDGLADAADGLGGGMTRERALEIMRDSRIGTYGTVTLGLVLGIKAAVLMSFSPSAAVWALILGHAVSRMAAVHVIAKDDYAREAGAKFVAPTVTRDGYRIALATALIAVAVLVGTFGLAAAMLGVGGGLLAAGVFRMMFLRKLQGYTGDCLGGVQQLFEVGLYLGLAIWL